MFFASKNFFLKNPWLKYFTIASLVLNSGLWFFFWFKIKFFDETIPLHYNIYSGFDLFGSPKELFNVPILGSLIFAVNTFLGVYLSDKEFFMSLAMVWGCLIGQIFLWVVGIYIIYFL